MFRGASWSEVLGDVSWLPIEQITGKFRLSRKSGQGFPGAIPIYVIASELTDRAFEVLADREDIYQQLKRITLTGLESLWSAICLLEFVSFPMKTSFEREESSLNAEIIKGQMKYWDWYCDNEQQFHSPLDAGFIDSPSHPIKRWHSWGYGIIARLYGMGVPVQQVRSIYDLTPREAGNVIKQLVNDVSSE